MGDRKYNQRGYQDSGPKREPARKPAATPRSPGPREPKPIQLPPSRTISRCAACGAILTAASVDAGSCPGCKADLHACTQCAHFDPGSRFQCARPIPEAIPDKNSRNACELFQLRTTVERDVSRGGSTPNSARAGFDALFKKK